MQATATERRFDEQIGSHRGILFKVCSLYGTSHEHSATSVCSTTCCFGPLPRPCWRSRPIHTISVHASACSPCCTPGRRTWDFIPTCTVSSQPVDWRSIAPAGSRQDVTSFYRFACSAACSAASCSPSSGRAIDITNYASRARLLRSLSRMPFTLCSRPCATRSGWSTPSLPSAVPNWCSSTWFFRTFGEAGTCPISAVGGFHYPVVIGTLKKVLPHI